MKNDHQKTMDLLVFIALAMIVTIILVTLWSLGSIRHELREISQQLDGTLIERAR